MARYLISGGSGFLGGALIDRLYAENEIVVVARNEGNLIKLKEKYKRIEIIPGDVADEFICRKACKDVDGVFHLAAFKHVGMAEKDAHECVSSNVIGTMNILKYSTGAMFVLGISTDKAAQVNGVYGATKFLMEKLFAEYAEMNPRTRYRLVRYGNVLYSTGSVLCKWRDRIAKGQKIIVTDPNATRFYWTVEEAVDLIFECLARAESVEPYYTPMKAVRLGDLASAMVKKYGKVTIETIGLQPGENMHEIIYPGIESDKVDKYTEEEILKLI